MIPTKFEILLSGQSVAICVEELVKPFVNTLMSLVGTEFNISTKRLIEDTTSSETELKEQNDAE